jgi:hypothetical protein
MHRFLDSRLRHGRDNALLHEHTRLGSVLERLLCLPLWSDRQTQRALVLLPGLEGVRELVCEVAIVLRMC